MKSKDQQSFKAVKETTEQDSIRNRYSSIHLSPIGRQLKKDLEERGIYLTDEEVREIEMTN